MPNSDKQPSSWLERISRTLLRDPHSQEELIAIIREAKDRTLINNDVLEIIEGALRVSEMRADDIMIPRAQMVMIESDMTADEAIPIIVNSAHSRFPVIDTTENKITGILLAKDLLQLMHQQAPATDLSDLIRTATLIPSSKRLNVQLKDFRLKRNHMAIVIDEYGNTEGLITIEDVLEQIVGQIKDEHDIDNEIINIKQIDTNLSEVSALTSIEKFNEYFDKAFDDEDFDTVGGLVLQAFSHLPKPGETVEIEDLEITILEATDRGIQLLRIYRNHPTNKDNT